MNTVPPLKRKLGYILNKWIKTEKRGKLKRIILYRSVVVVLEMADLAASRVKWTAKPQISHGGFVRLALPFFLSQISLFFTCDIILRSCEGYCIIVLGRNCDRSIRFQDQLRKKKLYNRSIRFQNQPKHCPKCPPDKYCRIWLLWQSYGSDLLNKENRVLF